MLDIVSIKEKMDWTLKFLNKPATPLDIEYLKSILVFHERRYYVDSDPLISDAEYDILFNQLRKIENQFPNLVTSDSPTQRVATDLSADFPPVQHIVPMLSLDNAYNDQDLKDFDVSIKKLCGLALDKEVEYAVEPKFDGGSIALLYENDYFVRAATRGNGTLGEDMTLNAKTMPSIPLKADFSKFGWQKVELRGEALIKKDVFDKINQQRMDDGLPLFANPRNAATGGLRMKNPNETRKRGLEAFMYQLGYAGNELGEDVSAGIATHFESIELLGKLGFKIPKDEKKLCKNIDQVIGFCNYWQDKRDQYAYEIDGMVIKVNERRLQEKCGSTGHHPRWAVAFKFKAKQATSKLIGVEYQVGKIGSITPVAKIQPVQLAGVTVSSISLHNDDFIQAKDLRIGDTVLVERAGDVIPYIVKSFPELRTGDEQVIQFPEFCPSNVHEKIKLVKEDNEAAWRCPDCTCGAQNLQKMIFHVSKDAMDIDGFGRSYLEKFEQLGWLKDLSDIYNLDYEAIGNLDNFGQKSAENLKLAIEKAKKNPIHRLLHSLSIHHLGKKASKLLAEEISHVLDLKDWTEERFLQIKDIGPVVARNVKAYFDQPSNIELLKRLEAFGVNLSQTEEDKPLAIAEDAPLSGKTILFTGTLSQLGRKQAEELAAKMGAKNISAVSSNLNILVVGEKAGSKLKKAQELGTVTIYTEEEFISKVNEGGIQI